MTSSKIKYNSMTTTQVANILCVAARTVSKWADSGRIKCWKINKDRRFDILDVIQFAKENNLENLLAKIDTEEIIKDIETNNSIINNKTIGTREYKKIIEDLNLKISECKSIIEEVNACLGQGQVKILIGSDECKISLSKRNALIRKIELYGVQHGNN